jgi:HlyD family secretion protein
MKKITLILIIILFITGCGENKTKVLSVERKTWVVKTTTSGERLFFNGKIEPLKQVVVIAPVDSVVEEKLFNYGGQVRKEQLLVKLNSRSLQKEYDDSLTAYLKAKDALDVSKAKFSGTEQLWKEGLIPRNTYKADKSSIFNNNITFLQARHKLVELLSNLHRNDTTELLKLRLDDTDKVRLALEKHYNNIKLYAPSDGVALEPPKSGTEKTSLEVGSQLKQGDVVTLVGDLSGLTIKIKIVEVNVDKIEPGMKALVKGVGFPGVTLDALVKSVNAQASTSGSGLPTFSATVEVPHINDKVRKRIKVGMSATVEVELSRHKSLLIPIEALTEENDKAYVTIKRQGGTFKKVEVELGVTTEDKVNILKGLKDGDVITWTKQE